MPAHTCYSRKSDFSQTVVQNSVDFDHKHKLDPFTRRKGFSIAQVKVNKRA